MKAWCTLLTDNTYINGQLVLMKSLKETNTKYPILCIVTPNVSQENREIVEFLGGTLIERPPLIPPGFTEEEGNYKTSYSLMEKSWHLALAKLHIFDLTDYEKIVYLDNDIWVRENIDDLFNFPHMAAVKDMYGVRDDFCTGLLVIQPNHDLYLRLIDFFNHITRDNGMIHDQYVLQQFYPDWNKYPDLEIPITYNLWTTYYEGGEENIGDYFFHSNTVKSYHMIDRKPWNVNKQYFIDLLNNYPFYSKLNLDYIDCINYCIKWLNNQGYSSENLQIIN